MGEMMKIDVTFRHVESSDALRDLVADKVGRLKKFFQEPAKAHVVLEATKHEHKAEINISAHGMHIFAKSVLPDMYTAIDKVVEKLEGQISKHHSKLVSHRPRNGKSLKMNERLYDDFTAIENSENTSQVSERKEFEIKPMMVDEALMQMDLMDNNFLVFSNAKTSHVNILKRKKNGKFVLIEAVN